MFNNLRLALLFVLCFNYASFSQKAFIETTANQKITVDDNFFEIQILFEKVAYKTPNSDKIESIRFKDINSAILGEYNMKRMTIADEKDEQLCFTLAESKTKKLIGYNKTLPDEGLKFIYYVLDLNGKSIEKIEAYSFLGDRYTKIRKDAEDKIRKHFSDCSGLMDRLVGGNMKRQEGVEYSKMMGKMLDRMEKGKANIVDFFETPTYTNCDEIKVATTNSASSVTSVANQKYTYEKISSTAMSSGTRMTDFSTKGTIIIKDNTFNFITKQVSTNYKIISFQDGVMKCDDNGNIHTVTISSESGKKGSYTYDTKITLVADKKMGGSTSYYWCNKSDSAE